MKQRKSLTFLDKTYIGILLVIFGGIVIHAPISVGFGTLFPEYSLLIKSWKEVLMLVAGVMGIYLLWKNKRFEILRDPLLVLIAIYTLLHLVLIALIPESLMATLAGLAIDLRYLLFFSLVYIALYLYPQYKNVFIKFGIFGAVIVLAFAALQVLVLPHDILKYIGYGKDTIQPYLTVDKNYDFIRINSTLRGPNPLGAYAGIVLVLTLAAFVKNKFKEQRDKYLAAVLAISGMIALWFSYSRSAIVGAIIGLLVVLAVSFSKLSTKVWISLGFALTTLTIGLVLLANTTFFSNVILHENPTEGNNINSNEGHVESLIEGSNRMFNQPFGAGIGSTGSASLFGDDAIIIENQYLFTAHETGWLGVGLFIAIFVMILRKLWQKRTDWLALGLFASGISLAMIGLFLPVFVDDTISNIWWGLAAIALATYNTDRKRKHE